MKNLKMFCISMEPNHYDFIKELGYMPVGLGEKNFNPNWMSDKSKDNISKKNKYYGEYTYHYWIWKNYLEKLDNGWIGFCQYRKFWSLNKIDNLNFSNLNNHVLNRSSGLLMKDKTHTVRKYIKNIYRK